MGQYISFSEHQSPSSEQCNIKGGFVVVCGSTVCAIILQIVQIPRLHGTHIYIYI